MGIKDVYVRRNSYDRKKRHNPQYDAKNRLDRDTMPTRYGAFVVAAPERAFHMEIDGTLSFEPEFWKTVGAEICRYAPGVPYPECFVDTPLLESDCNADVYRHEGECAYCGTSIRMLLPSISFCSNDCADAMQRHNKSQHRPSRAKTPTPVACAVCSTLFTPKRGDAIYCSVRCRVKAHREAKP